MRIVLSLCVSHIVFDKLLYNRCERSHLFFAALFVCLLTHFQFWVSLKWLTWSRLILPSLMLNTSCRDDAITRMNNPSACSNAAVALSTQRVVLVCCSSNLKCDMRLVPLFKVKGRLLIALILALALLGSNVFAPLITWLMHHVSEKSAENVTTKPVENNQGVAMHDMSHPFCDALLERLVVRFFLPVCLFYCLLRHFFRSSVSSSLSFSFFHSFSSSWSDHYFRWIFSCFNNIAFFL